MSRRHDVPGALPPLSSEQLAQMYGASDPQFDATELVEALSTYESDACIVASEKKVSDDQRAALSLFYSGFLFALLLIDDLYDPPHQVNEARFLTHRLPPKLEKEKSAVSSSISLLQALWSREYSVIYGTLRQATWPEELQPLVRRWSEHFRVSTFTLLSNAYSSLPPSLAATYLGLDGEDAQVVEQLTARGWAWDEAQKVLRPSPIVSSTLGQTSSMASASAGEDSTARLVELIGFLGEQSTRA